MELDVANEPNSDRIQPYYEDYHEVPYIANTTQRIHSSTKQEPVNILGSQKVSDSIDSIKLRPQSELSKFQVHKNIGTEIVNTTESDWGMKNIDIKQVLIQEKVKVNNLNLKKKKNQSISTIKMEYTPHANKIS